MSVGIIMAHPEKRKKIKRPYKYGYLVECRCRQLLSEDGAVVIRSSRSLGPADIIAIWPDKKEIWLVQAKKMDAPDDIEKLRKKFKDLVSLAGTYKVKPYLFAKKKGRYTFIPLEEGD